MNRLTNTAKWNDGWFLSISPYAKLAFLYLTEKCNIAGVYEIHLSTFYANIGITKDELTKAIPEIESKYIKSNNGKCLYIKNFLEHQDMLPLNLSLKNHKPVIIKIHEYLQDKDMFQGCVDMYRLLPQEFKVNFEYKNKDGSSLLTIENTKENDFFVKLFNSIKTTQKHSRKRRTKEELKKTISVQYKRFQKPTIDEIENFFIECNVLPKEKCGYHAELFYDTYEERGWVVGRSKAVMKDWKASARKWQKNNSEGSDSSYSKKSQYKKTSSLETIKNSSDSLKGVDWEDISRQNN
jgi:hypothetical protein